MPDALGARLVRLAALLTLLSGTVSCSEGEEGLGPAEAYVLLRPVSPPEKSAGGLPVVEKLDLREEPATTVAQLIGDGFAAEMVRSVHLAKQLVRAVEVDGKRYPEEVRRSAALPLAMVIGIDTTAAEAGGGRAAGLAFRRWLRSPQDHALLAFLGLPATLADDRALIQTLSGRLAAHAAGFVAGPAATPGSGAAASPPLVEGFRMAMEVISREWRSPQGRNTSLRSTAGSLKQRSLFADVRDNQAVMAGEDGRGGLRPAAELLVNPRVIATVIYRLAQTRLVANRVGPAEMYRPFIEGALPEGVSGGQVLGPIRNFVAKLFTAWSRAILAGRPPADGADLVNAYVTEFPDERPEVLRIFLVTTYAATVKPGGVSRRPDDATAAVAEIGAITEDLAAGRRTLKDAVSAGGK